MHRTRDGAKKGGAYEGAALSDLGHRGRARTTLARGVCDDGYYWVKRSAKPLGNSERRCESKEKVERQSALPYVRRVETTRADSLPERRHRSNIKRKGKSNARDRSVINARKCMKDRFQSSVDDDVVKRENCMCTACSRPTRGRRGGGELKKERKKRTEKRVALQYIAIAVVVTVIVINCVVLPPKDNYWKCTLPPMA